MMPDGLYDADILVWSEQQAEVLRRMAAGELLNQQVDWANLIEEVEDVGRSQLEGFESLFRQAIVHLIKLHSEPDSLISKHWRVETRGFLVAARRKFTPSMLTRIDVKRVFADACSIAELSGIECPYTLDMLLDADGDIHALAALLQRPA